MRAETWTDVSKTCELCLSEPKPARFQASLSSPFCRETMPALPSNGIPIVQPDLCSYSLVALGTYICSGNKEEDPLINPEGWEACRMILKD
ncbi:hypothetical protein ACFLRM_06540 [Acidobacteriota bacterium]